VAQDMIFKNHIDGTGVAPAENEDIEKPTTDDKVLSFNFLLPLIM